MTSSDFVAGHPIAIRVGGRRLSQSHPTRASLTKASTHGTPSTSPEDQITTEPQPVPDYPRPTSHPAATQSTEGGVEGSPNGNEDGSNRKERRRQEKKKDKYQTEEDKMHGMQKGYPDARMASKEGKMINGSDKGRRNSASTAGTRITQPSSKFMV